MVACPEGVFHGILPAGGEGAALAEEPEEAAAAGPRRGRQQEEGTAAVGLAAARGVLPANRRATLVTV